MKDTKKLTARQLKEGQKIESWTEGKTWHGATATVKQVGPDGVVLLVFEEREERVSLEATFEVELTDTEFIAKHRSGARAVMEALCNRLAEYKVGYHEMWNGWLSYDPYEMAAECAHKKIRVVGYCDDIMPKRAMFSGEILDVGICAEYEDGERFWCHYKSDDLRYTFKKYADLAPAESPWATPAKEAAK